MIEGRNVVTRPLSTLRGVATRRSCYEGHAECGDLYIHFCEGYTISKARPPPSLKVRCSARSNSSALRHAKGIQRGCPDLRGADYDLGKFSVPVSGDMIVLQAADLQVWKLQP